MITKSDLERIDSQKMFKIYDKWPEIAKNTYKEYQDEIEREDIDHVIFVGMGGSGAVGDVFSSILSKENIHVTNVKGYHLPKTADEDSLVVFASVSGNTSETLSVLNSARESNCKTVSFSSGGKMEEYCNKFNLPHRKITQIHSPRASFIGFFYGMLRMLKPIIQIKESDINESFRELEIIQRKISSSNLSEDNPAIKIAKWINGIPLIYYPWGLQAAATRYKNSLQENAKMHAITEDVIEACHNGIVSWEKQSIIQPILLQGQDDYIKTKERFEIIKEFFLRNNIDYKEIHSIPGSILTKMVYLIYMLDYVSIYRAVFSNVDPSPVLAIDYIKNRLNLTDEKFT